MEDHLPDGGASSAFTPKYIQGQNRLSARESGGKRRDRWRLWSGLSEPEL